MGLVLFVDMDSFYASCELLRHPELSKKAFIVGTYDGKDKFRGVVETANYLAKKSGVKSAMPTIMAYKINPDLHYVPSDHEYYDQMSRNVMEFLQSYKFKMEVLSVDEAALDISDIDYKKAEELGKEIKKKISDKLGLPCTVGISTGKIFAKMVCDDAKPDGLKIVKEDEIIEFLKGKDIKRILGVGNKTAERLNSIGIKTIGDLAKTDTVKLIKAVGSFGAELHDLANGKDNSQIVEQWQALSIGRERTLDGKTNDIEKINKMLDELSDEVMVEVARNSFSFKTVTVKARYSDFTEKIKGKSFMNYTDSQEALKNTAHSLIKELIDSRTVRKVGVRVSSFAELKGQKKLF